MVGINCSAPLVTRRKKVCGGGSSRIFKIINVPKIEVANQLINEATYHLERNGSAKMIFMDLSLQLSKAINP